jgi:hypothetical protein
MPTERETEGGTEERTERGEQEPGSTPQARHTRSFIRAFVATNYLLGKRRQALGAGLEFSDPVARGALSEITAQLGHGLQEQRARVLAGEVGRLLRSLGAQRLK